MHVCNGGFGFFYIIINNESCSAIGHDFSMSVNDSTIIGSHSYIVGSLANLLFERVHMRQRSPVDAPHSRSSLIFQQLFSRFLWVSLVQLDFAQNPVAHCVKDFGSS